jgi:nucleotide exchange factor SIL1
VGNEWLYQIHDFVELEDVADLDKLGGLKPVIDELDRPEEELRTLAAWVLGKASQNNLVVQKQVGSSFRFPSVS